MSDLPQNIIYEPSLEFSNFVSACVPESNFGIPYMSVEEVEKALSNLNTKKATGMDDIPASFLKTTSSVLAGPLCEIINHSFSEGKFPTEWKCAKIIALYKGGKLSVCDNYRPISVLPVLSKIMEKHISDSFYKYLTDNQLLCSNQSGFRPLHSCQTVLVNIVNEFNVAMNQGNMIGCVAADLRKAFDVISHEILLKKMQMYGCNRTCLNWFQSYLS